MTGSQHFGLLLCLWFERFATYGAQAVQPGCGPCPASPNPAQQAACLQWHTVQFAGGPLTGSSCVKPTCPFAGGLLLTAQSRSLTATHAAPASCVMLMGTSFHDCSLCFLWALELLLCDSAEQLAGATMGVTLPNLCPSACCRPTGLRGA